MRIGILEDDQTQIALYRLWFSTAKHQCTYFGTIAEFVGAVKPGQYELLVIDWVLPDGLGEVALRWVRETLGWEIPVVCISMRDAEADVVNVLRLGADDYLTKPPRYLELLARIESLARRRPSGKPPPPNLGNYLIDEQNRQIFLAGQAIELTQKEYELARFLFFSPGKLHSRMQLLEEIWGLHNEIDTRTVDTHVSRIRKKLRIFPENGWEIISVYGYGYRLETASAARPE